MSGTLPANPPRCLEGDGSSIELVVDARPRDLGGFAVRRVLPAVARRLVGPFIFYDHMGPALLPVGSGMDVRPHPHVGLATVTYLFDGEIDHRDSLGTFQTIRPGDVNWMLAGRGIAHSERSSPASRASGVKIHGIQSWVAVPLDHEEDEPRFEHHPSSTIPKVVYSGAELDVIAGTAYGQRSPVSVVSPTLYVHALLEAGASVPLDEEHEERAAYVVTGALQTCGQRFEPGTMVVFRPGANVSLETDEPARLMLLGGKKLEGERHVWWNFVSSSQERIQRAKDDWANRRFGNIPGDEIEFIPLPTI
jgi:redox-sensitive bicupin YhaK (pirin superfamily)